MGEFSNLFKTKKKSFTDVAYEKIKELILNEDIGPGEIVSENQLAEYMNMSRTPVREAIRRLEAEGILVSRQGIGTIVKMLTLKDIEDIFENYYLEYRDRGIINYVYDDVYDLGEEMIDSCYDLDDYIKRYIDYEKFGNDLLLDDYYVELDDGRVVSLNY